MATSDQMVEDRPHVDYYELSQSEYRTMRAELKAYRLEFANRRSTSSVIISGTHTTDVVDTSISLEGPGSSVVTNCSNSPASTGRKKWKQCSHLLLKDCPIRKTYIKTGPFRPLIKENAKENTIVVHDLPEDACEASLIRKFEAFGTLCKVSLARDADTGMLSGMAHVSYASIDDAEKAWIKLREDGFESDSRAILIHQLSKKNTQNIACKLHGHPVSSVFHPSRHIFFIATKNYIRVHDLVKNKLIRKLEPGVREISSIAIQPAGDNVIVGSHEGKLCWFDMDLSSQPYQKLKCHAKDIANVAFHRSYPLFASCSDDSTAYVFHGMVYSDLNQNPLIVPLEILRGHKSTNGRGVMDCVFHPRQPWLFTAGADSVIKLYC